MGDYQLKISGHFKYKCFANFLVIGAIASEKLPNVNDPS